jgi:hypothetical protein
MMLNHPPSELDGLIPHISYSFLSKSDSTHIWQRIDSDDETYAVIPVKRYIVFDLVHHIVEIRVEEVRGEVTEDGAVDISRNNTVTLFSKRWDMSNFKDIYPYPLYNYMNCIFRNIYEEEGRSAMWEAFWMLEAVPAFEKPEGSWIPKYLPGFFKEISESIQRRRDRLVEEVLNV